MIKKIVIRDVASYDHEGCTFDDLTKVNIIYGGNGTGKTTLSRVLYENKELLHYPNCSIEWEGNEERTVLVYNQDFKKAALQETIPGVFTLGEDWIEDEAKLLDLMEKASKYQEGAASEEEVQALYEIAKDLEGKMKKSNLYKPSINYINGLLKESGFTGFTIQLTPGAEDSYQIQRLDGSFAHNSLSEGEVTFITFLYFIQIATRCTTEEIEKNKIVVIDDPISSLDHSSIEVVSTLVSKLFDEIRKPADTRAIEQAFVMTHNMAFYKQVSPPRKRNDTHFWRLEKRDNKSFLLAYGNHNPIKGGYEYLWQQLREERENVNSTLLQNLMRNIVETYFVQYGGYNRRALFSGEYFEKSEDKIVMQSLFKWLDHGSHEVYEDIYSASSQVSNDRYMELFHVLFVKLGHEAHYKMMMRED